MISVITAKAWLSTPVVMLFVLAALQSLSQNKSRPPASTERTTIT